MFGREIKNGAASGDLPNGRSPFRLIGHLLLLLLIIYVFLLSIEVIGSSFHLLSRDISEQIILATASPFIALFIGLLATVIIQSSSTTTSLIVAVVASGSLSLESAVPMIMGANIGTTVTSTFAALGHISKIKEFRRAIAAGTIHDFFNILTALVLFPLEYYFGLLSRSASYVTGFFSISGEGSDSPFSPTGVLVRPVAEVLTELMGHQPYLLIPLGAVTLFLSIKGLAAQFNSLLSAQAGERLDQSVFGSRRRSLAWGIGSTALVQSSSVTTSMVVPVVAYGSLSLKKVFPFVIGANIGTTLTALLAAASRSDSAVSIALVHLFFNLIGAVLFYFVPWFTQVPLALATGLGKAVSKNRFVGFIYILCTFFLLPFLLIYATGSYVRSSTYIMETTTGEGTDPGYVVIVNTFLEKEDVGFQKRYEGIAHLPTDLKELRSYPYTRKVIGQSPGKVSIDSVEYLLRQPGFCYLQAKGGDSTCVTDRLTDFTESDHYSSLCYVFRTTLPKEDGFQLEYFDPKAALVVRSETYVQDRLVKTVKLLAKEE